MPAHRIASQDSDHEDFGEMLRPFKAFQQLPNYQLFFYCLLHYAYNFFTGATDAMTVDLDFYEDIDCESQGGPSYYCLHYRYRVLVITSS